MNPNTRTPFEMHMMDSHSGTHLVPPAYALPPDGFDDAAYAPEVRPGWPSTRRSTAAAAPAR